MNQLAAEKIGAYIWPDETLIWAGQPKKGIVFEVVDIFKTLYMVVVCAIIFIAIKLLFEISFLIAIPVAFFFISVCGLLLFVRFFIDARLRRNTYYGLTNKRIIIKSDDITKSIDLTKLPKRMEYFSKNDGSGTIELGIAEQGIGATRGIKWIPNLRAVTSLYLIPGVVQVYQTIIDLRQQVKQIEAG